MGECEQFDGDAAGHAIGQRGTQRTKGAGIGGAWKEAVAIDQAKQRHWLAA